MEKLSCIVPFHKEGENVLSVIAVLSEIPAISEIICVDDGSRDDIADRISARFPKVTVIKLHKNAGKSHAVYEGLKIAREETLLLMDADLRHLQKTEIEDAITHFNEAKTIDMLILENKGGNAKVDMFLNKNIFLSGQRILKRKDLETIFSLKKPIKYQLEIAINAYMIRNQKKVFFVKTSSFNPHKVQKHGLLKGMSKDLEMDLQMISYVGISNYFKQMRSFGRQEVK